MEEIKPKFKIGDRVKIIVKDKKGLKKGEFCKVERRIFSIRGIYLYKLVGKQTVAEEEWLEGVGKIEDRLNRK